jgi:sporulation protein YlmC with PRC-barrel domain
VTLLAQFTISAEVSCQDGDCGEVSRVVTDPVARTVTHLVVEPKHRRGPGRLVPLELVVDATRATVRLSCDRAGFVELEEAEETQLLPSRVADGGYRAGQVLSWPYYGLGSGGMSSAGLGGGGPNYRLVTFEKVPLGEVAVRRGEHVHAADGEIGRVEGLIVDPADHQVTHVLLQEGHLWGRRQVAIPIGDVIKVDNARRTQVKGGSYVRVRPLGALGLIDRGVQLKLTKQQVRDLPGVDLGQPER